MHYDVEPIAGSWYHYAEKSQKFKVLDVNEESGDIEVQYFDGAVDQIDYDMWDAMEVELLEDPQDWTGPMDNIDKDDDTSADDMQADDWASPYDENLEKQHASPRDHF